MAILLQQTREKQKVILFDYAKVQISLTLLKSVKIMQQRDVVEHCLLALAQNRKSGFTERMIYRAAHQQGR